MNRREVLMLAGISVFASAYSEMCSGVVANRRFFGVYDSRFYDADYFGSSLGMAGVDAIQVNGLDAFRVWREALKPRVASGQTMIGLTTYSDFQILRSCATDIDRKVDFIAIHDARDGSATRHEIICNSCSALISPWSIRDVNWQPELALSLAGIDRSNGDNATVFEKPLTKSLNRMGTLVSWVIA